MITREVLNLLHHDIDSLRIISIPNQLFKETDQVHNAILNNKDYDNSMCFSRGYASVAINLLSVIIYSNDNLVKDCYILPSLYAFRIYMENSMKESILLFQPGKSIETHSLNRLWEMMMQTIPSDERTNQIHELIMEYEQYDPDSTAFRYSRILNKELGRSKGRTISSFIDIQNLQQSMIHIYHFLEGINDLGINYNEEMNNNN